MDIRVGSVPEIGSPGDKSPERRGAVEARILAIRPPRRRAGQAPAEGPERRDSDKQRDPINGRVLLLLIPDANMLPKDLGSGEYRVFLRFARR